MITITPNTNPINNINQTNRYQPNGNAAQRFQNPARQNFFQPFRAYRQGGNGPLVFDPEFDGKRLRKSAMRKTVDYNAAIIKMLEVTKLVVVIYTYIFLFELEELVINVVTVEI